MHTSRRLFQLTIVAASAVTLAFGLSTIFIFGAATHRDASLGWTVEGANADLVQAICVRGQMQLAIDFFVYPGVRRPAEPRGWHAGISYLPGIDPNLRISSHAVSRYGVDLAWDCNGPQLYVGVLGLYPTLLLWTLAWLIRPRRARTPGCCSTCGYDLRASPDRCPECGKMPGEAAI